MALTWHDKYLTWHTGMLLVNDYFDDAKWRQEAIDKMEIDGWSTSELNDNFTHISNCLYWILEGLWEMRPPDATYTGLDDIIEQLSLDMDTGTAVDWKAICRAWWEAPLAGWGWTIQLIDFMRKGIWNEPENIISQESFLA